MQSELYHCVSELPYLCQGTADQNIYTPEKGTSGVREIKPLLSTTLFLLFI